MNEVSGKVALITGGASGIGKAVAEMLVRRDAAVVLADIDGERAVRAAKDLGADKTKAATLDVTDESAVQRLVDEVASEHGHLDYIFNNAGVGLAGEVRDMRPGDWRRLLDINLRGVVNGVQAAYPLMVRQGFGHIVNTASIAGLVPFSLSVAYSATKHAVVGLSTSLRAEGAGLGVKVSVVCPGFIDTPMKDALTYLKMDKEAAMKALPFKLQPVERCAREILDGVARNRAIIVVTAQAKLMWILYRISPGLVNLANTIAVARSRRMRVDTVQ